MNLKRAAEPQKAHKTQKNPQLMSLKYFTHPVSAFSFSTSCFFSVILVPYAAVCRFQDEKMRLFAYCLRPSVTPKEGYVHLHRPLFFLLVFLAVPRAAHAAAGLAAVLAKSAVRTGVLFNNYFTHHRSTSFKIL
jgi:hypothetical protein